MEANGQPHAAAALPPERSERSACTENIPNPEDGYTETDPNEM